MFRRIATTAILISVVMTLQGMGGESSSGSKFKKILGIHDEEGGSRETVKEKSNAKEKKKTAPKEERETKKVDSDALSRRVANDAGKDAKTVREENAFVQNSLEEQVKALEDALKDQKKKHEECLSKASEMRVRAEEYQATIRRTEERIRKIRGVLRMIEDDPDALASLASSGKNPYGGAARSSGPDPLYSGGPGAVWGSGVDAKRPARGDAPPGFDLGKGIPDLAEEEDLNAPLPWGDPPIAPVRKNEVQEWRTDSFAGPEIEDRKPADSIGTLRVLASDGEGPDSIVIISAGQDKGVKKGMLFAVGEGKNRTVLTVTQVYPTCARTVPHPRFARRKVEMNDLVLPLSSLPE